MTQAKRRSKSNRFPRPTFWRDHHRELSAIVRGDWKPRDVTVPVGRGATAAKRRARHGGGH